MMATRNLVLEPLLSFVHLLVLVLAPSVLASAADPSPPASLLTSLSATETIRSASPLGPVYSQSTVKADTRVGAFLRSGTSFGASRNETSLYLRLCRNDTSYYEQPRGHGGNCTSRPPLPGQCLCLNQTSGDNCTRCRGTRAARPGIRPPPGRCLRRARPPPPS